MLKKIGVSVKINLVDFDTLFGWRRCNPNGKMRSLWKERAYRS